MFYLIYLEANILKVNLAENYGKESMVFISYGRFEGPSEMQNESRASRAYNPWSALTSIKTFISCVWFFLICEDLKVLQYKKR